MVPWYIEAGFNNSLLNLHLADILMAGDFFSSQTFLEKFNLWGITSQKENWNDSGGMSKLAGLVVVKYENTALLCKRINMGLLQHFQVKQDTEGE